MTRWRRVYGARPLHLLAVIVGGGLIALAIVGLLAPGSDVRGVASWFVDGLVASQLLLVGLARLARGRRLGNHVRVPALLSVLLALVGAPLILGVGADTFRTATGDTLGGYGLRWLAASAALFGVSGLVYAVRRGRASRRPTGRVTRGDC